MLLYGFLETTSFSLKQLHFLAVARLRMILKSIAARQKRFMKQLSEPVLTTISVQAGPPGMIVVLMDCICRFHPAFSYESLP
jgi:hypothetical protein